MESYRKSWNKRQTELRGIMMSGEKHQEAIKLFLSQHAVLHSARMAPTELWSYEDEILDDMSEAQIRRTPHNCEHSVAWIIWHLARIEDVAMNMLVAGEAQILNQDNWLKRMKAPIRNTGNAMGEADVSALSAAIDIQALRAYRLSVGRRTRQIAHELSPEALKQKVDPSRLQQVLEEGAVVEAARGVIDYWGKRDIAGLLLMPPTRHNFIHLNEAARLKRRRQ